MHLFFFFICFRVHCIYHILGVHLLLGKAQVHIPHDKFTVTVCAGFSLGLDRLEYLLFVTAFFASLVPAKLAEMLTCLFLATNAYGLGRMFFFCRGFEKKDGIFQLESLLLCA